MFLDFQIVHRDQLRSAVPDNYKYIDRFVNINKIY